MKATGAPQGPFAILDIVGLRTAYNIGKTISTQNHDEAIQTVAYQIKKMVDNGKLGRESGEEFYTYPNPDYKHPQFLEI